MARFQRQHFSRRPDALLIAVAGLLSVSLVLLIPYLAAGRDSKASNPQQGSKVPQSLKGLPPTDLTEDEAVAHALNRLGYGPRPGDVDAVKQMGLAKWIDRQLHPESIDDSALQARLSHFSTLNMSSQALLDKFPRPKAAAQREGVTPQQYRQQQQAKLQAARQATNGQEQMAANGDAQSNDNSAQVGNAGSAPSVSPQNMTPDELAEILLPGAKQAAKGGGNPLLNFEQITTPQRITAELAMAKMDRAVYSEKQLYEQMVDFWFNHFNVFAGKGVDRWLLTSYERDAIRPHAMGKFRDLLEATAKSPAMLFYLDNWQSVDPKAWARLQQQRAMRQAYRARFGGPFGVPPMPGAGANPNQAKKQERGLNENYGRELMELHTLGVDGGYTQDDVVEVAGAFTGWSIRQPQRDAEFFFDEALHDSSSKMVLGHKINAGGMRDGEEVLDLLARDPHTARHLSLEIARHFVSDNPPDALVERMAQTYESTDGDIRAVLHTMIYSRELPRQGQDAFRTGGFGCAGRGRGDRCSLDPGAMDRAHRRAALSMPASHGLCG